jgi:multidrug efflux pump subunit AcrA (membrane-fusion protein)
MANPFTASRAGAGTDADLFDELERPSWRHRIFEFVSDHKWLIGFAVLAIGGGAYYYFAIAAAPASTTSYVVTAVHRGDVIVSVQGTGQVVAVNQLDLKPVSSGIVKSIPVKEGDEVKAGQTIATLDEGAASVSLAQANANVEVARASYQKLLAGATSTDVQASQVSVDAAQVTLDNAQKNLADVTAQQSVLVSNAYRSFLNSGLANAGVSSVGFSADPSTSNVSSALPAISGTYTGDQQGEYRIKLFNSGQMYFIVSGLETGEGLVNTNSPIPLGTKGLYIQFPAGQLYSGDSWTIAIPNTRASNYLGNLSAYQTAQQNQTQALHNAQASVDNAKASLQQAQANLSLKQEPARAEDLASAKAQIDIANAQLASAELAYHNNIVTAPFGGRIAQVLLHVGDQAGPSTAVATLITDQLLMQMPLNEVDAAKVQPGQLVTMAFDAISGFTTTGTVMQVETLGTVTQGVVDYQVKVTFPPDARIKPDMSVQATVVTNVHSGVLSVPSEAITAFGNQSFVQIVPASAVPTSTRPTSQRVVAGQVKTQRQAVQVGLANDTVTEITSGLQEGDWVVVQRVNPSTTPTTGATGGNFRIPGLGGFGGGGGARSGG